MSLEENLMPRDSHEEGMVPPNVPTEDGADETFLPNGMGSYIPGKEGRESTNYIPPKGDFKQVPGNGAKNLGPDIER
jgi:hypothetical protein